MFEKGDRLVCVDDSRRDDLYLGEIYIYDRSSKLENIIYVAGDEEGYYTNRFKLYPTTDPVSCAPAPFIPEYFSALNEKDAEKYIGKVMEFADGDRLNNWEVGVLKETKKNSVYSFFCRNTPWHFTRTCPQTFQDKLSKPKPPTTDPALIKALELTVQTWQIMFDADKDKEAVYKFLGGMAKTKTYCFLCDYVGGSESGNCDKCIKWVDDPWGKNPCCSPGSSYHLYICREHENQQDKQEILDVLNHLKQALKELKNEK